MSISPVCNVQLINFVTHNVSDLIDLVLDCLLIFSPRSMTNVVGLAKFLCQ